MTIFRCRYTAQFGFSVSDGVDVEYSAGRWDCEDDAMLELGMCA